MNIGEHHTEVKAVVAADIFASGDGLVDILRENCIYDMGKGVIKEGPGVT